MNCFVFVTRFSGIYQAPLYYYPNRGAANSFVVALDLKAGAKMAEHWIRRAASALLSLDI